MRRDVALESLLDSTAMELMTADNAPEGIAEIIYSFLCRAYESHLTPEIICKLLGVDEDCVFNRARLSPADEDVALAAYAAFDGTLQKRYG